MHAGLPVFQAQNDSYAFGNDAIALHWTIADRSLCDVSVVDRAHGRTLAVDAPFVLTFADGRTLDAASLRLVTPLREEALPADPDALRNAERVAGKRVIATLGDSEQRLRVEWSVEQREGSLYLRQYLSITALLQDEAIASVSLLRAQTRHAKKPATSRQYRLSTAISIWASSCPCRKAKCTTASPALA
ncbi:hypothetical protein [Paraburkholderia terrae]